MVGTLDYVAPEVFKAVGPEAQKQVKAGARAATYGYKVDVWQVGCGWMDVWMCGWWVGGSLQGLHAAQHKLGDWAGACLSTLLDCPPVRPSRHDLL